MRRTFLIARVSLRELMHERAVTAVGGVALFVVLASLILGELTLDEQERMIADLSLFAAEVGAVFWAAVLGASSLAREIEKQTCLLVLARPVSRFQFLLGKWMSLVMLQGVLVIAVVITMCALMRLWPAGLPAAALSIWLKSVVILSWVVAFSNGMRPMLAAMSGLAGYLLAHWLGDLYFFAQESDSALFMTIAESLRWIVPSFDLYNWKSHFHLVHPPAVRDIIGMTLQAVAWSGMGVGASAIMFGRRDIV